MHEVFSHNIKVWKQEHLSQRVCTWPLLSLPRALGTKPRLPGTQVDHTTLDLGLEACAMVYYIITVTSLCLYSPKLNSAMKDPCVLKYSNGQRRPTCKLLNCFRNSSSFQWSEKYGAVHLVVHGEEVLYVVLHELVLCNLLIVIYIKCVKRGASVSCVDTQSMIVRSPLLE